jgi:hypothetical protein
MIKIYDGGGANDIKFTAETDASSFINNGGKFGIGTSSPSQLLTVSSTSADAIMAIDCGHASSNAILIIESAAGRDSKIKFTEADTTKWEIYNDGSDSDKLKISDDGDVRVTFDQAGNVTTASGSAISYDSNGSVSSPTATTTIASSEIEYTTTPTSGNQNFRKMKSIKVVKSGKLRIKFTAKNQSGSQYWRWIISKNNSGDNAIPTAMTLTDGNTAAGAFSAGLANGVSNSVHTYRDYDVSVKDVTAGDTIELWMAIGNSSGGAVNNTGQGVFAKDFSLASTTPTVESPLGINTKFHADGAPKPSEGATVIFSNTEINIGGGYDTSTGLFTAPIEGAYFFSYWANATNRCDLHLQYRSSSGADWDNRLYSQNNTSNNASGWFTVGRSGMINMLAGSQVRVLAGSIDAGGTTGWDASIWNGFSGFLVP